MFKGGFINKARCPKGGGSIYLDSDHYGWYEECLQCGYNRNLKKMPSVKVGSEDKCLNKSKETTVTKP